jgi:ubiquinone/menaquinone biosynthesis C-methylase UbiE
VSVTELRLLPKEDLIATSGVDHADWNYNPLLSYVMRRRFELVRRLLPHRRVHRILEIGFGSGVFMPDLVSRCDELYGVDIHSHVEEVRAALGHRGVAAKLSRQDAAHMDFPDAFFDLVVCVSALEFVQNIDDASGEIARVLQPRGLLVGVMPAKSAFLDFALQTLTGANPREDYGERRERVVPVLQQRFRIVRTRRFPPVYAAYALELRT